jgi:hypothetical protein
VKDGADESNRCVIGRTYPDTRSGQLVVTEPACGASEADGGSSACENRAAGHCVSFSAPRLGVCRLVSRLTVA